MLQIVDFTAEIIGQANAPQYVCADLGECLVELKWPSLKVMVRGHVDLHVHLREGAVKMTIVPKEGGGLIQSDFKYARILSSSVLGVDDDAFD